MCTLYVFDGSKKETFTKQIADDWQLNSHGGTVIMLDEYFDVICRLQTTEKKMLIAAIKSSKAFQYMVHLRMSTGVVGGVPGCHGFDSPEGRYIYCHNGVIEGSPHRVDSMIVGEYLDEHGTKSDISHFGDYVNLTVYDSLSGEILIHRGESGTLHHDKVGNWSTKKINKHFQSVNAAGWYSLEGKLLQPTVYPVRVRYRSLANSLIGGTTDYYQKCDRCESYKANTFVDDYSHDRVCLSCAYRTYGITANEYKRLAETEITVMNDTNAETETDNNVSEWIV